MDRWVGAGIVAFAVLFYVVIVPAQVTVPRFEVGGGVGGLAASPLFFPRFMAVVLGVLGASLFVRGYARSRSLANGEGFAFVANEGLRVAGAVAILAVYAALLDTVGYVLLTPVALFALSAFLGYRRWWLMATTAIVFTALVYCIFRYGMKILLPEGLLD
jgi:putative tricarboxylic transport membrane protein